MGKQGKYPIEIIASSGTVGDERDITLEIFLSQADLIQKEIEKTEEEYESLKYETELAEKYQKEVSKIKEVLPQIEDYISKAETSLNEENYEAAMENIATAKTLIGHAQTLLSEAGFDNVQVETPDSQRAVFHGVAKRQANRAMQTDARSSRR